MFYLYVIECLTPKHFYVGLTHNPKQREQFHRAGVGGAVFTAKHGVKTFTVVGKTTNATRAKAAERELVITMSGFSDRVVCGAGWSYVNSPIVP